MRGGGRDGYLGGSGTGVGASGIGMSLMRSADRDTVDQTGLNATTVEHVATTKTKKAFIVRCRLENVSRHALRR
jgi:hypothetical protein